MSETIFLTMQHAYMYSGAFETNYPALRSAGSAATYRTTAGDVRPLPPWPEDVDGLRVAFMEKAGKKFFVVRVQFEDHDVVLGTPVAIDRMRHLGNRRLSPSPIFVGDDLAEALLDDLIAANPDQRVKLALVINRVNQVRRGTP